MELVSGIGCFDSILFLCSIFVPFSHLFCSFRHADAVYLCHFTLVFKPDFLLEQHSILNSGRLDEYHGAFILGHPISNVF